MVNIRMDMSFLLWRVLGGTSAAGVILRKMKSPLRPEVLNHGSNEIRHQFLSAERARTQLNWKPRFTLESGLDRTLAWYHELLGAPDVMAHVGGG